LESLGAQSIIGMVSTRNIVGLSGFSLLTNAIGIKKLSSIPAIIWVLTSFLLGRTENYTSWWSWPIKDRADVMSAILSGVLCLLGILISLIKPRQTV